LNPEAVNSIGKGAEKSLTNVSSMSIRMAVTVISVLPITIIYPFLQRYFISGLLIGSIKA
jgi:putative aldouronate transport system permease protein